MISNRRGSQAVKACVREREGAAVEPWLRASN
jgi:hypothetical protein